MTMQPLQYLDLLRNEYLDSFIAEGGAAVKFVVPLDATTPHDLPAPLRREATDAGYAFAFVDSASKRVDRIEHIFFDIARQLDWDDRARAFARRALDQLGFGDARAGTSLDFERIARDHGYEAPELSLQYNRWLQQAINHDFGMAKEFRIAMMRLCQAAVDPGPAAQTTRASVIEWLTGELRRIAALGEARIYQKITRANARHMFSSLTHWLRCTGTRGLVLALDIRRLAVAKRVDAASGAYYTKAAVLDAYEVLRQLIDGTDELEGCLVVVICDPEVLDNAHARGFESYLALRYRVSDEVRDRRRVNPLAALVRLSAMPSAAEAVSQERRPA